MVGRYQQNTDRLVSYNTVDARPDLEQGKVEDQVENSENDSIHLNGGAPNMDDETRYPDYHDDTLNTTTQQEICSVYSEVDKIMWSSVMSTLSGGSETFFLHRGEVSAPSAPGVVNVVAAASTMLPRELSPVKRNYEDISIVDMDVTVSDSSLYISTDMGENSYEEEENGILLYQSIETQDSLETDCMAHTMPSESNYKVTTVVGESNQNAPGEELSTIADNLSLDSAQRLETQDGPEDEYSQLSAPSESNNVNPTVAIESNQNDAGDELLPIADNLSVDSAQKLETQERSEDEDAQLSVPSESNNVIATEMGESNQNGAGDELLPIEDKLSVDSAQGLESQEGVEDKDASRSSPSESSNVIAAVAEETNQNDERVELLLTDNEQSVNSAQRLESQEGVEEEDALCSSHSEGINEITTVEDKSTDDVLRDELGTDEVKRSSDSESQDDDNESSGILVWEDHNDDKTPFEGDEEVQTGDDVSRQQFQRCTDLLEEMKTEDQEDYRENYDVPLTNIYHQLPENMTNYGLDDDHPTNADTEEKEPRLGNNDNGNTLTGS